MIKYTCGRCKKGYQSAGGPICACPFCGYKGPNKGEITVTISKEEKGIKDKRKTDKSIEVPHLIGIAGIFILVCIAYSIAYSSIINNVVVKPLTNGHNQIVEMLKDDIAILTEDNAALEAEVIEKIWGCRE
jgi:DNA-directed RNA polymerase subunit RPC12/RpoP